MSTTVRAAAANEIDFRDTSGLDTGNDIYRCDSFRLCAPDPRTRLRNRVADCADKSATRRGDDKKKKATRKTSRPKTVGPRRAGGGTNSVSGTQCVCIKKSARGARVRVRSGEKIRNSRPAAQGLRGVGGGGPEDYDVTAITTLSRVSRGFFTLGPTPYTYDT